MNKTILRKYFEKFEEELIVEYSYNIGKAETNKDYEMVLKLKKELDGVKRVFLLIFRGAIFNGNMKTYLKKV